MNEQPKSIITIENEFAGMGRRSATISIPGRDPQVLTYESYDGPLAVDAGDDAFLMAPLLLLMEAGYAVHVDGQITSRLLINLHELQTAWARWRPTKYKVVQITARDILDTTLTAGPAISAFSGGVDASYTVFNLTKKPSLVDLQTVIFVHGFDIPIDREDEYKSARDRGESMLSGLGLKSVGLKTNFRALDQSWEDSFGLAVSSCLTLFQDKHSIGLIGSGKAYDDLNLPWGSTPATDHLNSTGLMDIRHYGAGASRTEKMENLLNWPAAMKYLRVCWQGERGDSNCGRCEKCIRTFLNFKVAGAGELECFEQTPDRKSIRGLRVASRSQLKELVSILDYAKGRDLSEPWLPDLRIATAINSIRVPARKNKTLRRIFQAIK
ncbi:hypothetical protein [Kocuria arenosa]|uniref:hypothetical protein n=1 Tax=Kocuria arenosa TaxID=3071446 RepID=UPI0034D6DCE0